MSQYEYPIIYQKYVNFCIDRDIVPWSFEDWMTKKDAKPRTKYEQTLDFIQIMEKLTSSVIQ